MKKDLVRKEGSAEDMVEGMRAFGKDPKTGEKKGTAVIRPEQTAE